MLSYHIIHISTQGAIAASAPIAQFTTPCDAFGRIVTSDFSAAAENSSCSSAIRYTTAVAANLLFYFWILH